MDLEFLKEYGWELREKYPHEDIRAQAEILNETDRTFFMIHDRVPEGEEISTKEIPWLAQTKGIDPNEIFRRVSVKTAVHEWLSTVENKRTRAKYKNGLERVFSIRPLNELLEKNLAITTLDKHCCLGVYKLIEELDTSESLIKVCLSVYARFCDFIRILSMGLLDPEESPKEKEEYYPTVMVYNSVNWQEFISSLSTPFNLLAELAFEAAKACGFRVRLVNSRKNVLDLDTSQLDFDNRLVKFKAHQSYNVTEILGAQLAILLENGVMDRIKEYLGSRTGAVFQTQKGKPLHSIQVIREFKKASAKYPFEITPTMLTWGGVIAYKERMSKDSK